MSYGVTTHTSTSIRATNAPGKWVRMRFLTANRQCTEMKNAGAEVSVAQWCHSTLVHPTLNLHSSPCPFFSATRCSQLYGW